MAEDLIIGEGTLDLTDVATLQQAQQQITQLNLLSEKIDELGQANVINLKQVALFVEQKITGLQFILIIITILTAISTLGLHWAIFLYFQSRNLILSPKTQNPLTKKEPKKKLNITPDYSVQYEKKEMI